MHSTSESEYLASCCAIAQAAGDIIMGYFTGNFATQHKEDKSPVTDADIAANHYITEALAKLTPHIPVIAEEDKMIGDPSHAVFWLVDPLDGTRSFVRGEPEFSVNIGLIENRRVKLGVLHLPPQKVTYFGEVGKTAWRVSGKDKAEPIRTRAPGKDGLVIVRSKSHPSKQTAAYLETLKIKEILPSSSAAKFGQVAEGSADLYPRFGRTMEWDTAAGHAILEAAGGRVETAEGEPLLYGKPGFENPAFIAYGR